MNRAIFYRSLAVALTLAAFAAAPARAADPVFPPGSRVGLVPLPGMVPSASFPGFEDRDKKAAIVIAELPAQAYADIEKATPSDALKGQGVAVESRVPIPIAGGRGFLMVAQQDVQGVKIRKWLLVAEIGDITALVNFQV